jgi:branched-chain amino acid transport system permease protein
MSGTQLLQAVVDGILTGGVYALMAAGLSLIFGVMDIINIAQGVMVILGGYLSYVLSVHLGIGLLPGLLITVPAMFLLGVAVEFLFMRRLRESDRTSMSILITYAVAILIEGALSAIFGIDYVQLHASYVDSSVHVFGFYLPWIYLIGFGLAVALLAGMYVLTYRTKFGRAVRASLQNRTAADLIGINVNRVRTISVGIGISVTAVGGMVFGATNAFNSNSGYDLISRLLAVVILGGLGSVTGAMFAAILLLTINDVVAVVWSPTWAPLIYFAALVVVLSIRPQGLFGGWERSPSWRSSSGSSRSSSPTPRQPRSRSSRSCSWSRRRPGTSSAATRATSPSATRCSLAVAGTRSRSPRGIGTWPEDGGFSPCFRSAGWWRR